MSTLLDDLPAAPAAPTASTAPPTDLARQAAGRLRARMAAVRLSFTWFGVRKTLNPSQKAEAADTFGADGPFLSATKKLLDTRHPAFQAVTAIRGRALAYWRGLTLPYPDPGVRLIRQDDLAAFQVQLTTLQAELAAAVGQLDEQYAELRAAARARLGRLYNAADYPPGLEGLFAVQWEFPSVEPPEYLRQLAPQLYRQEADRVAARFDEALRLAEQAFVDELSQLVSHLNERLSGSEDGQPKVFRDSSWERLHEFFERFRHLNVGSSQQLDELVAQAQRIVRGVEPQAVRDQPPLRQQIARQLAGVQATLDGLLVDRPRRNILRRPQ